MTYYIILTFLVLCLGLNVHTLWSRIEMERIERMWDYLPGRDAEIAQRRRRLILAWVFVISYGVSVLLALGAAVLQ